MRLVLRLSLLSVVWALVACGGVMAPADTSAPGTGTAPVEEAAPVEEDVKLCPQVIQYARPASGGSCQLFPTPCDVPRDYLVCCAGQGVGACLGSNVQCVDDPQDTCDPQNGGVDCPGICQPVP